MWIRHVEATQVNLDPTEFCGHRHCVSGDVMVLVCHVISQDHATK